MIKPTRPANAHGADAPGWYQVVGKLAEGLKKALYFYAEQQGWNE